MQTGCPSSAPSVPSASPFCLTATYANAGGGCTASAPPSTTPASAPPGQVACAAGASIPQTPGSPQEPGSSPVTSPAVVLNIPDHGGPTVAPGSKIFMISVNNPLSTYGNPDVFWGKMNQSPMIHILDQYVGGSANYPLCDTLEIDGVATTNIQLNPLVQQAYNTFLARGDGTFNTLTGTSALYDIFIPSDSTGPNVGGCSDHGPGFTNLGGQTNVTFLFAEITLLPGCGTSGPSVNGHLIDTIASTVTHENFEAISDPTVAAWIINQTTDSEIADVCNMPWQNYKMNDGSLYFIQSIFSNEQKACAYSPP